MAFTTPGEQIYIEFLQNLRRIDEAGLPTTSPESNRARVNNTDASRADSQGLEDSQLKRAIPDISFNASTFETFEEYSDSDRLAAVENEKRNGKVSVEKQRADNVIRPWFD